MSLTASGLSHVYPQGTRVNDRGHLEIGGCDAIELARDFGTPAYVVAERDLRQEVLVRITPGVAGDTHHAISTGQADSKFGFAVDQAPEAIAQLADAPHLELVGLHFHIGSQLYELEPFRAAVRAIATL